MHQIWKSVSTKIWNNDKKKDIFQKKVFELNNISNNLEYSFTLKYKIFCKFL